MSEPQAASVEEAFTRIGPFVRLRGRIVEIDFGKAPTDEAFQDHFAAFGAWYERNREPLGCIVVLAGLMKIDAKQRKALADFDRRVAEYDRKYTAGCAIIAPSALARGIAVAVYWLSPPVYPYKVFATYEEGRRWVEAQLRERSAR